MSASGNLLVVDTLFVTYNHSIAAVHGVSFSVGPGKITALLGANGAGKTTVLKAVANIIGAERGQVTGGRIRFDGQDVLKTPASDLVRSGLASVLEGRHVFKSLTVEENLITGGIGRDSSRREIKDDLEKIYAIFPKLISKRREIAGLTSGGEQQMIAIGRALMSRPRLLILDEPSMGLAPLVVQSIFKSLKELNVGTGLSILLAEQNASIALKYADEATVIENGVSVLSGPADELKKRDDIKSFYLGGSLATSNSSAATPEAQDRGEPLVAAQ